MGIEVELYLFDGLVKLGAINFPGSMGHFVPMNLCLVVIVWLGSFFEATKK